MFQPNLVFDRYLVTLSLTEPVRFHLNHGGVLRGVMSHVLGQHALPTGVIPFACESGRSRFDTGEQYHIGLTLVGESRALGARIEPGLEELGRLARGSGPRPTLGGNFEVVGVQQLPPPDLQAMVRALAPVDNLTLRFVSPLRLERPPELKTDRQRYANASCFPADHFLKRLFQRLFLLEHGRYPDQEEIAKHCPAGGPVPPDAREAAGLWLDVPIDGPAARRDPKRPKGYTLGGYLGTVALHGLTPDWMTALVYGRYLHAGESIAYGFGAYRICAEEISDVDRFVPAVTMLDRIANVDRLSTALDHVLQKSEAAGLDGMTPEDVAATRYTQLSGLAHELTLGTYRPDALKGFLMQRPDGRLRPVAVPTVRDRVAQRAACTEIAQAIETMLDDCTFAYRKGLSRQSAVRAIERAWDDGFRYVLDADISAFFDSVDWKRLFAKLHALWPSEPLVELLKAWIRLPVVFEETRLERDRGLPQGLPISPVLANLFLDEFDEELLGNDYRIVRYADDFVVLCKDATAAERARDDARAALANLGLSLNDEKTGVKAIDTGFTYLGFLFCRSLAFAQKRPAAPEGPLRPDAVPALSWLAQVPFERIEAVAQRLRPRTKPSAPADVVRLADRAPDVSPGLVTRPLYLSSLDTAVNLSGETLVIERKTGQPLECPTRLISHVALFGRVRVTVPVLLELGRFGVPVYLCRAGGDLVGSFVPVIPDWTLWGAQSRYAADPDARLGFARSIVGAKLYNYASIIRRFRLRDPNGAVVEIERLAEQLPGVQEIDALVGYEGRGAARYFEVVGASLDPAWQFIGRRKNPPPDPINSMLSLGYTVLHNHVSTELIVTGLNPRIGLLHKGRGAHHALASDLMEPFRHLIDGLVWGMVHRGEVAMTDFTMSHAAGTGCFLTSEFRRTFLNRLMTRLLTFKATSGAPVVGYREAIHDSVKRYVAFLSGRTSVFEAFRVERD